VKVLLFTLTKITAHTDRLLMYLTRLHWMIGQKIQLAAFSWPIRNDKTVSF